VVNSVPELAVAAGGLGQPCADCLGMINDAAEFAVWLSPHILANTGRVLAAC
jgi:hypothetical protein